MRDILMTMKTKYRKQPARMKTWIILGSFGLLILGGVGVYGYITSQNATIEAKTPPAPLFSFDSNKAPGWHQSQLDTTTPEGRTSILLFDRDMSTPPNTDNLQSCHVSAFLNTGAVDISAKRRDIENDEPGRATTLLGTKTLSLHTSSDIRPYELYQYQTKVSKNASPIKEGYALGFVQFEDHFVELQAVCDTSKQLKSTLPALQAISYHNTANK